MRNLSESQIKEEQSKRIGERRKLGESLVHGLTKRPYFGKGIAEAYAKSPERVINLAFAVKNVEEHLSDLTEAQISATLGTTPENVLRVLRLGYLNTCRQDAFWEMGLATAHDIFFYLEPKYRKTLRGANAGEIMYESKSYRSASDISSWDAVETVDGAIKTFSFAPAASEIPISPFTVMLYRNGLLVANDDGRGNIRGKDTDGTEITGSVNYATGAASVTFTTAPVAGQAVSLEGGIALEKDNDLEITQAVDLSLRAVPFTLREYPITASFSKKLELVLGTSYKVSSPEIG
jgi:hypothetical protein